MDVETAQRLWLVYIVPFLDELAEKPLVVVDYDLLMLEPRSQLERIARKLALPYDESPTREVERFISEFLDPKLRHTVFSLQDIDASTDAAVLTRDAYALLYELADDRRSVDDAFWRDWADIESAFGKLRTALVEAAKRPSRRTKVRMTR